MDFVVAVLLILLALNVWVTRRIVRLGPAMDHKGLHIAMLWIAPFIGALMAHAHVRAHAEALNASPPQREGVLDAVPQQVAVTGDDTIAPYPIAARLHTVHGVPLLDWRLAEAWLAGLPEGPRAATRLALHRGWLLHLRDALGAHVSLRETDTAWVLSSLDAKAADAVAQTITRARQRITRVLGELARFPPGLKNIVLLLDDEDDYYHYVAAHDPGEGEAAFSGGMFIDAGCPHFVLRRDELHQIEPVIVHELTHSALAHLRLPLWLDEGLAVNTEQRLTGVRPGLHTPHELHALHLRFWTRQTVQQFWTGESFRRPDDGNLLSYDLARMIVSQLSGDRSAFQAFVAAAQPADAGHAAAAAHLDVSLDRFVAALFGHAEAEGWVASPAALSPPRG